MRKWQRRLAYLCFGLCIGSAWAQFDKGNVAAGVAWVSGMFYTICWILEQKQRDYEIEDKEHWKSVAKSYEAVYNKAVSVLDGQKGNTEEKKS